MAGRTPLRVLYDDLGRPVGLAEFTADDRFDKKYLPELVKGDVGLGNVDNTADSAKPVSVTQQTALNAKANRTNPSFDGATTTIATEVVRHDPAVGINAGYEIGSTAGQATTPYMDFHCGATPTDYDVRFLFSGGNGSSGNGNMTFMGAMLTLAGRLVCNLPLRPAQYTLSTLPSASAYSGCEIDVTDAAGGPKRCRSNGSVWQILNTTQTVS